MIIDFEEITEDLSKDELALLPDIKKGFEILLANGATMKAGDLVDGLNYHMVRCGVSKKEYHFNGVKLRKWVNHFRTHSMLALISTSEGYSITTDKAVLLRCVMSMEQRAQSIHRAAIGLKKLLTSEPKIS